MSDAKTLPRPEDVLDESRIQYQAMTALSDEEYRRLADDIRERGVLQPIITDEEGTILDGHHRAALAKHFDLDASREPAYVVIGDLNDDSDKLARAIKQNVIGRDTEKAVKSHSVKQYIETTWDRTDDGDLIRPETDTDVAEKLGVSQELVSKVVNRSNDTIIDHERMRARRYKQDNPDASFREIARNVDAAKATVTRWIKEDFDEGDDGDEDDEQPTLTATTTDRNEAEKTADVFRRSQDDEDDDVRQEAEENAERLARGDTSPDAASKNVEIAEAEKEVEAQKESEPSDDDGPAVREVDAVDLLGGVESADALVTDPPYTTDVDDIESFVQSWLPDAIETIGDGGVAFITVGAYADELQTYLNALDELGVRDRTQVLVWTYKNTIGRAPSTEYKRNWQAILFVQSEPAVELDAPLTSERWGVQDINAPDGRHDGRHHKWEKPTELIGRFIRHTTEEGDTVVDPFVGTGTTALVAHDLGRKVVAGDCDGEMLAIADERGCLVDE